MFSFRDQLLRDHQRILSAYLSLGPRIYAKIIDRTETLRITCPTFHKSRIRIAKAVEFGYLSHRVPLPDRSDCVVTVQQVLRDQSV